MVVLKYSIRFIVFYQVFLVVLIDARRPMRNLLAADVTAAPTRSLFSKLGGLAADIGSTLIYVAGRASCMGDQLLFWFGHEQGVCGDTSSLKPDFDLDIDIDKIIREEEEKERRLKQLGKPGKR